jgi:hypothetical protein
MDLWVVKHTVRGLGSGHAKSIEWPRRGSGRCSCGQAEVGEDLRNDGVYLGFVCIEIFILINW